MAFIPVENTAEMVLHYVQDGQNLANVLHFTYPDQPTADDLITLATALGTWWNDDIKTLAPSTVNLAYITGRDLTVIDGVGIEQSANISGASSDPPLPTNCTVAVKCSTGFVGRSYRGRIYHVGLTEGQTTASHITAEMVTLLEAAYSDLQTVGSDNGCVWSVVSRFHNGAPRVAGIATPILNVTVNSALDSQRRRLPERGT